MSKREFTSYDISNDFDAKSMCDFKLLSDLISDNYLRFKNPFLLKFQLGRLSDLTQKSELQKSIIQNNHDMIKNEKGKCVAFTYAGKLLAISDDNVKLLKKLKSMDMLNNHVFIYSIPLEN